MKKLFISALALASLAACSKEEVLKQQNAAAIEFDQAFVENSTRAQAEDPSTTTNGFNPLTAFDVWAFMDTPDGVVLGTENNGQFLGECGEDVEKNGTRWVYKNLQYWTPDHDYYFGALAPMNSPNVWGLIGNGHTSEYGLGHIWFTNVDGSEDLLYASAHVNTDLKSISDLADMPAVKFTFNHLLSKVKFTFKNGMTNGNARIVVKNIKMDVPSSANIRLGDAAWWEGDKWELDKGGLTLEFGNVAKMAVGVSEEADKERLTIPTAADYTYNVEFDVELYYGSVLAYSVHKASTISNIALQMGKAYNFSATIDADNLELTPIEFTVEEVKDWDYTPSNDYSVDMITNNVVVNNASGLNAVAQAINSGAIASDATIVLNEDINLAATRANINMSPIGTEEKPFTGTIDGQGHKISNMTMTDAYAALVGFAGENAVIKNLILDNVDIQSTKYGAAVVCVAGKNVTVQNVTVSGSVKATSYAAGLVLMNNEDTDNVNIINCVNNATVSSSRAAGIAAWVTGGSLIENVTNNGNITGEISAAGIANRIGGTIKNAVNNGEIVGNGTEPSAGIAGTQTTASTYEYCYNYGKVTTTKDNANSSAAGILGQTPSKAATINYCANFADITAEQSYAAGIAYSLYGNINASYCYNAGAINGADGAGAIAPKAQYGANDKANYCLNAGTVASTGGKVYQASNKNTSCYYYKDGSLCNVADNAVVGWFTALQVLNGGADQDFFSVDNNGKIVVVK